MKYTPENMRALEISLRLVLEDYETRINLFEQTVAEDICIDIKEVLHILSVVPDMYEVLSLAADYLHDLPNDEGDSELNRICKLVRKALAKAEGKTERFKCSVLDNIGFWHKCYNK